MTTRPPIDTAAVFTRIYQGNLWGGRESVSGPGSDLVQTEQIRLALPGFLARRGVGRMLDIPCGDFNWMQHVDLDGVAYIGADVVSELVERNRRFEAPGRSFAHLDLTKDPLPAVDLVFCRDCLVHLSFADIQAALENVAASDASYLLTTTFLDHEENRDISTGDWRPLNLCKPPFNLPAPLEVLSEACSQHNGRYRDKSLGLWRVADVRQAVHAWKSRKRIALFTDGQGWVVDRIVERLAQEWAGSCDVQVYAYTRVSAEEFVEICNAQDGVYYANWDIARFESVLDQVRCPIVMSVRSFRYPDRVRDLARRMAAVHVINPELLTEFSGAHYIPDGVDDEYVLRDFVVGLSAQPIPGNLDYKGYFLVRQACEELGVAFYPALGDFPAEDMPRYYRSLDVFVCASLNEGFGAPLVEARAMGVPVISTPVGVANELTGVTLVERDVASIKAAIASHVEARTRFQAYAWPEVAARLLDVVLTQIPERKV
jgi:hypothetical protein